MPSSDDLLAKAKDPSTPLTDLHVLAQDHPELRAAIASNPSTYPALLEWLGSLGEPDINAALRARSAATPSTPDASVQAGAAGIGMSAGTAAVFGNSAQDTHNSQSTEEESSSVLSSHTAHSPQAAGLASAGAASTEAVLASSDTSAANKPVVEPTVDQPVEQVIVNEPPATQAEHSGFADAPIPEQPTVVHNDGVSQETVVMSTTPFAEQFAQADLAVTETMSPVEPSTASQTEAARIGSTVTDATVAADTATNAQTGPVPAGQWNTHEPVQHSPNALPAGQWEHSVPVAASTPVTGPAPVGSSNAAVGSAPGVSSVPLTQSVPTTVLPNAATDGINNPSALLQPTQWQSRQVPPLVQPVAGEEKKSKKTLLWVILAVLVIILAIIIGGLIAILGRSDESTTEANAPAASTEASVAVSDDANTAPSEQATQEATTLLTPTPSPTATNKPTVAPAPADAVTMDSFTMPSGNITCHLSDNQATCTIAQHNFTAQGPGCTSSAAPFSAGIAEEGTAIGDCNTAFSQVGTTLNYGSSAKNGSMVCTASEDGARCWSQVTGQGFVINRDSVSSITR
ncbi:hypothetical protein [Actinomyces vulturis]|uniref:variant leucine-rich repeat-containing protein n=1 Tax=Actinomyces vulturis TaxID=1857645 RepID=UPI000834EF5B|nr:hypothetical protein [Actinomyces vulturis]